MEVAAQRPQRLLPLRVVAALLFLACAAGVTRAVLHPQELRELMPGLSPGLLTVSIVNTLIGASAAAVLAFGRRRAALWVVLAGGALEFTLELAAGGLGLHLVRIPVVAGAIALASWRAWPELR